MQNHNDDTIKPTTQFFKKIYLSLYLKGLCVRGSWRPNRTATHWLPLLWPSTFLSRSPGLLNRGPGAPSAGCCFLYSIISPTLRSPNSLHFLCTEIYNSSTPTQYLPITGYRNMQYLPIIYRNMHFRRLWNGMFDRHRAEITVMQVTGHSLPVHQFVTVPWDFNPVPYCQPSSLTLMEYATSADFGMACLAGSEVNIQQIDR